MEMNFEEMIKNSEEIRKNLNKEKKPPKSVKPLHFEPLDGDSDLKLAIVERINAANMTYSDLYAYCARMKSGDVEAGNKMASNLINGLRTRNTMIDKTFSILCDFLGYDILLCPRKKTEEAVTTIEEDEEEGNVAEEDGSEETSNS